jgi:protocatechuate 3,4-dioxygenase beta subunit
VDAQARKHMEEMARALERNAAHIKQLKQQEEHRQRLLSECFFNDAAWRQIGGEIQRDPELREIRQERARSRAHFKRDDLNRMFFQFTVNQ